LRQPHPAEVLEIVDGLLKTATEYGGVGVVLGVGKLGGGVIMLWDGTQKGRRLKSKFA